MYQLIHPSSFFIGLFAFRPFKILSGVMATLICSAGHDRPSRACSAPPSMPNDLKQGHCSGKLPGRTGGKRFFAARTGLSIHIIVSMSAAKAACCTDVRQFHLSNISRCAGVRATRMSSCAKNCDNVTPKASQIFSSDANDGVIDFLYHEEMVDCGRPERSAS